MPGLFAQHTQSAVLASTAGLMDARDRVGAWQGPQAVQPELPSVSGCLSGCESNQKPLVTIFPLNYFLQFLSCVGFGGFFFSNLLTALKGES